MDIFLYCLFISLIWGATNPLIKKSTSNITKIESNSVLKRFFYDFKYLVLNWKYVLLFFINQSGAVLFFILLQHGDLSLVVPLTNALTVIFTGICGTLLGEEKISARLLIGTIIISIGIIFCVVDKSKVHSEVPV